MVLVAAFGAVIYIGKGGLTREGFNNILMGSLEGPTMASLASGGVESICLQIVTTGTPRPSIR